MRERDRERDETIKKNKEMISLVLKYWCWVEAWGGRNVQKEARSFKGSKETFFLSSVVNTMVSFIIIIGLNA